MDALLLFHKSSVPGSIAGFSLIDKAWCNSYSFTMLVSMMAANHSWSLDYTWCSAGMAFSLCTPLKHHRLCLWIIWQTSGYIDGTLTACGFHPDRIPHSLWPANLFGVRWLHNINSFCLNPVHVDGIRRCGYREQAVL